jgi:hypothetical protein
VIEVGFGDERAAFRALGVVAAFGVRPPRHTGHVVQLEVVDGARTLVQTLRALDGEGLDPLEISVREPSLDDVFLALTGRPAEADQPDARPSDVSTRGAA